MARSPGFVLAASLAGCPAADDGGVADGSADGSSTASTTNPSTTDSPTATGATTRVDDSTGLPGACNVTPGAWAAPDWAVNTVDEAALSDAIAALTGDALMRGAENGAVVVDELSDLTDPYAMGTPSLASVTNPGFQDLLDDAFAEFVAVIAAGPVDLIDAGGVWTPGVDGGIFGDSNRGFDEGGIEVRQIADKGLFSAGALYYHAMLLTEADIDAATVDRLAYAWGGNATLDAGGELDDSANYSNLQGFHAAIVDALAAAKAYAADMDCTEERDAAIVEFFDLWERTVMSRHVFYMNTMALGLLSATTDDDFAEAMHELNEGIGLVSGFYGLPDPARGPLAGAGRTIDDAEIETLLGALGVDLTDLGQSTTGRFVESLPNFEAAQSAAEVVIMDVYRVDMATINSWRTPTPG